MFGFGRKSTPRDDRARLVAPFAGRILPLSEVPDPVFAGGLVGPGFAVDPDSAPDATADALTVTAPLDGEVILLPDTLHAVGIRHDSGAEVLVHVGVDTVKLKGKGFDARVAVGDRVQEGQPLLEVDLAQIREGAASTITPVIVTNADSFALSSPALDAAPGAAVLEISSP